MSNKLLKSDSIGAQGQVELKRKKPSNAEKEGKKEHLIIN